MDHANSSTTSTNVPSPRHLPKPPELSRIATDAADPTCKIQVHAGAEDTSNDFAIAIALAAPTPHEELRLLGPPPSLRKLKTDCVTEVENCVNNLLDVLPSVLPAFERAATDAYMTSLLEDAQTQAALEDSYLGSSHSSPRSTLRVPLHVRSRPVTPDLLPSADPRFERVPTDAVQASQSQAKQHASPRLSGALTVPLKHEQPRRPSADHKAALLSP